MGINRKWAKKPSSSRAKGAAYDVHQWLVAQVVANPLYWLRDFGAWMYSERIKRQRGRRTVAEDQAMAGGGRSRQGHGDVRERVCGVENCIV